MSLYGGWPKGLKWNPDTYTPKTVHRRKWQSGIDRYNKFLHEFYPKLKKTKAVRRRYNTALNKISYFARLLNDHPYKREPRPGPRNRRKGRTTKRLSVTSVDSDASTIVPSARSSLDGSSIIIATPAKKKTGKHKRKFHYAKTSHVTA